MTIEDQIAELLAQAQPLRALPDAEAEKRGLPALVDRINALRTEQAAKPAEVHAAPVEGSYAQPEPLHVAAEALAPVRKKPGRKPKVAAE